MRKFFYILLLIPITGIPQTKTTINKLQTVNLKLADNRSAILPDSIAPDTTGMRNLNSVELSKKMIPGWNVGNSLDAIGGETAWGNPVISQKLIDSVKAAGFKAIRIPIAWSKFSDTLFTIQSAWMDRVEEVVNYVLNDSMYAIINIHWDGGWMQPTYAKQEYVNNRLAVMWRQIAVRFRNYDDHLIFAGTNEVMVEGDYGTPKVEYYTVQNSFNQTFVSTVRSTGGRNVYRHLAAQGFNTNIDHTYNYFAIPTDVTKNRLMVEVHYYDPYNFALNSGSTITQWGKNATNPSKTETWANESYADAQFNKMKTRFIDNGYAVILGEYGAISRLNLGSAELNAEYAGYRLYYIEYITQSLVKHGLVPFYWDNGFTGNYSMGIFNRSTGSKAYPDIVETIINAADTNNTTNIKALDAFEIFKLYPNPANDVFKLEINNNSVNHFQLYNSNGQMIKTLNVSRNINTVNISNLSAGLYFLTLYTPDGNSYKQKFIKR